MSYTWFRVDSSLAGHPKERELAAELGDPNALAYVIRLWCWTQLYAPIGQFPKGRADRVEAFCGWAGERGRLIEAMIKVGWLDAERSSLFVHDWEEMQGKLVAKAERDKTTKRDKRAKEKAEREEAARAARAPGAPTDVTDGRNETDDQYSEPPAQDRSGEKPTSPQSFPQPVPTPPPTFGSPPRSAGHWGKVGADLARWMLATRELRGRFNPTSDDAATKLDAWAIEWCLKYQPEEAELEVMRCAFVGFLDDPTMSDADHDARIVLWLAEGVWFERWGRERARAADERRERGAA